MHDLRDVIVVSRACFDPLVILKVGKSPLGLREIETRVNYITPDSVENDVLVVKVFAAALDG
jgi:hypothetical protein